MVKSIKIIRIYGSMYSITIEYDDESIDMEKMTLDKAIEYVKEKCAKSIN